MRGKHYNRTGAPMTAITETRSMKQRLLNPYRLETRSLVLYHALVLCIAVFSLDLIAATRM